MLGMLSYTGLALISGRIIILLKGNVGIEDDIGKELVVTGKGTNILSLCFPCFNFCIHL